MAIQNIFSKYSQACILFIALGCGNRVKNIPLDLLSRQKSIEDSISFNRAYEDYYMQRALENQRDSEKMKQYVDSSLYFLDRGQELKKKLHPLALSVDSLTKIK